MNRYRNSRLKNAATLLNIWRAFSHRSELPFDNPICQCYIFHFSEFEVEFTYLPRICPLHSSLQIRGERLKWQLVDRWPFSCLQELNPGSTDKYGPDNFDCKHLIQATSISLHDYDLQLASIRVWAPWDPLLLGWKKFQRFRTMNPSLSALSFEMLSNHCLISRLAYRGLA